MGASPGARIGQSVGWAPPPTWGPPRGHLGHSYPTRGPAFPEPCCLRQGRRGLLGAQGSPTSAQFLPGACKLREVLAPAHVLIPSPPPARPTSGITCNWNLGSPASSGTQGTWPQAKSGHPPGEGARSRQGGGSQPSPGLALPPPRTVGRTRARGGGPQVLPDQASHSRGSRPGEELWPQAHPRPSKLSPARLEMPQKGAFGLHGPRTLATSGQPPLLVDKPRSGLPSKQSARPENTCILDSAFDSGPHERGRLFG